ncbi:MAG: glutamine synthetase III [Oscillospiraceae bacterium]|jgi:glutamine synthetase|nr:glutamine synthetase III [Oscillospiraceae bacterium]
MLKLPEMYGMMVFNDHVMKHRLSNDIYEALHNTIQDGSGLDADVAEVVAEVMKEWAIELGATHYTHWFQPMTGITAEKHESFISPTNDGRAIMEFSSSALVQGEADASSLPSGGLRATFEARGYTAWDPTSYAFVRGNTLYIPTAFCSYGGEALDEKTPLLRSMQAINKQALRILRLFGNTDVTTVRPMVGAEQEYFLIDKAMFEERKDLMYTGRTLFGAKSPKGQELDDQYYGAIKPRVSAYMKALDEELWKLGVPAKTEHNESAPAQHELAAMYTTTNLATDHNQLIMEIMQSIAKEHGMICALHEKPFDGISGSGKHNNWSLATNNGVNLLDPGATPHENAQFLLFLVAVIKAVDEHQDLLRISTASAGNDCRLGSGEAPPAIISVFIGDELFAILEAIESDLQYSANADDNSELMKVGATVLPSFSKDTTDRNRTSPFAFTGNKFEFRMVGSKMSIAKANIMINTTVAESLRVFADELEGADDFNFALQQLIKKTISAHKRILFNGNSYGEKWVSEAHSRGLLNLATTPDALPYLLHTKNIALFECHKVFSHTELLSRYEIGLENYCKLCNIEAVTMYKLVKKNILPAGAIYSGELSEAAMAKKTFLQMTDCTYEQDTVFRLSELSGGLHKALAELFNELCAVEEIMDLLEKAYHYKDTVLTKMSQLRAMVDEMELLVSRKHWPFPTYGDLLFSVR